MSKFQIHLWCTAAILLVAACPDTACAELPGPVRDMIEAVIASGDQDKVAAVVEVAKQTNPGDVAEVDALIREFQADQREQAVAQEAQKLAALRSAGLFDNWTGKGEVGASRSSGNSDDVGISAGLSLTREGIDWSHRLRGTADYQRSNGVTSREQFFASYEPRYQLTKRLFAYGLAQYERDQFQGFSARYVVSSGIGYRIIDGNRARLAVKIGPAYRRAEFIGGGSESQLAGLIGMDFNWNITDRLTLTQDTNMVAETGGEATVVLDSANTSINLITGLEAKVSDRLTMRMSYVVEYDSKPPPGAVSTDTLSRFTLVYGF